MAKAVHLYEAVVLGRAAFDFTACGKQILSRTPQQYAVVNDVKDGVTCKSCLRAALSAGRDG